MEKDTAMKTENEVVRRQSSFLMFLRRLSTNKGAMFGLFLVLIFFAIAIFAPWIMPYQYDAIDPMNAFLAPCKEHWFGTDNLGRDVLSRLIYGSRYSLTIGFLTSITATLGGIILGSIAGFFGNVVDNIIMRICDLFQAIPSMVMNIVIVCVLGNGFINTIIALAFANLTRVARIMRSSILGLRKIEYIDAATAINCSNFRIIWKHAIPNALSPVLVNFTLATAGGILGAVQLSYIGLGVQPPLPEWGAMLTAGKQYIRDYPYLCIIPGVMIMILVLALNLLGDGIRDSLDPKLKK